MLLLLAVGGRLLPEGDTAHGATPVTVTGGFFVDGGGSWLLAVILLLLAHGATPVTVEGGFFPGTPGLAAHGATPVTPKGGCCVLGLAEGGRADGGGMLVCRPVAALPARCFGGGLQSPMPAWRENRWLNAGTDVAGEALVASKDDLGGSAGEEAVSVSTTMATLSPKI